MVEAESIEAPKCTRLTWTLCVATYNRIDILTSCLEAALHQTRKPIQVIIVDASDSWERNREIISGMMPPADVIPLTYLPAPKKSLTAQRNRAIDHATGNVLFMIDDDSLMYSDCAEEIMRIYEADIHSCISCVGACRVALPPSESSLMTERKISGTNNSAFSVERLQHYSLFRWVYREVLLMSIHADFVWYDRIYKRGSKDDFRAIETEAIYFEHMIAVFALTVRREVVAKEKFENALVAYCPGEDQDATYRFSRHGFNVTARNARIYHHEAATGRLKRRQATALRMTNLAFFIKRHSRTFARDCIAYYVLLARKLIAEFLKDALSRRWSFPQFVGALTAVPISARIFLRRSVGVEAWYEDMQLKMLGLSR